MKTEWDVDAAISTYNVDGWGSGYFTVNAAGNAEVRPLQEKGGAIDILEVVNEARSRGLGFPLVIRFQDLLAAPRGNGQLRVPRGDRRSSVTRTIIAAFSRSR